MLRCAVASVESLGSGVGVADRDAWGIFFPIKMLSPTGVIKLSIFGWIKQCKCKFEGFHHIIVHCCGWCHIMAPRKIWEEVGIQWMVNILAKSAAYTCSGYGRHVTGHDAAPGGWEGGDGNGSGLSVIGCRYKKFKRECID